VAFKTVLSTGVVFHGTKAQKDIGVDANRHDHRSAPLTIHDPLTKTMMTRAARATVATLLATRMVGSPMALDGGRAPPGDLPARSSRAHVWVVSEMDKMRTAATREGRAAVAAQLRVLRDKVSAVHRQSTPAAGAASSPPSLVGTGHLRHSTPRLQS
jgi:hypothetical protein